MPAPTRHSFYFRCNFYFFSLSLLGINFLALFNLITRRIFLFSFNCFNYLQLDTIVLVSFFSFTCNFYGDPVCNKINYIIFGHLDSFRLFLRNYSVRSCCWLKRLFSLLLRSLSNSSNLFSFLCLLC